jgi:hypothetical protein
MGVNRNEMRFVHGQHKTRNFGGDTRSSKDPHNIHWRWNSRLPKRSLLHRKQLRFECIFLPLHLPVNEESTSLGVPSVEYTNGIRDNCRLLVSGPHSFQIVSNLTMLPKCGAPSIKLSSPVEKSSTQVTFRCERQPNNTTNTSVSDNCLETSISFENHLIFLLHKKYFHKVQKKHWWTHSSVRPVSVM